MCGWEQQDAPHGSGNSLGEVENVFSGCLQEVHIIISSQTDSVLV